MVIVGNCWIVVIVIGIIIVVGVDCVVEVVIYVGCVVYIVVIGIVEFLEFEWVYIEISD